MVVFELCDREKRTDCLSDTEIEDWLKFKYLTVQANEMVYHQRFDPGKRIQRQSIVSYYALSFKSRTDIPYTVSMTQVNFSKIPFGIDVNPKEDMLFNLIGAPF